jgi:hypothetical protein
LVYIPPRLEAYLRQFSPGLWRRGTERAASLCFQASPFFCSGAGGRWPGSANRAGSGAYFAAL